RISAVSQLSLVQGPKQRVTIHGTKTRFGQDTTVETTSPNTWISRVGFVSRTELFFDVLTTRSDLEEGDEIRFQIRSPLREGGTEELELSLAFTREAEAFEFDFSNLDDSKEVVVDRPHAVLGYRMRGYAPFTFEAT